MFGKARSARCPELVASVCLDPLKSDPKSVLLARTLMDARRLLNKSRDRLMAFTSGARRAVREKIPIHKFHIGLVKGVLQAARELCK